MAQNQPKLTEITELLFQQVVCLQETMKQNITQQVELFKKIKNIEVKVNVSELRTIEHENLKRLKNEFANFHNATKMNNEELLKMHKVVSSKRFLYLILLNIFLVLSTCLSIYIAIRNTIQKSDYVRLESKKNELVNQLENVEQFYLENPKTGKFFKEWSRKQ